MCKHRWKFVAHHYLYLALPPLPPPNWLFLLLLVLPSLLLLLFVLAEISYALCASYHGVGGGLRSVRLRGLER